MRFVRFLGLLTVLTVLVSGSVAAPRALAATGDKLSVSGTYIVTTGQEDTLKVKWTRGGKPASGKVHLQKKVGSTWKTYRSYPVTNGTGSVKIRPVGKTTYRLIADGFTSNTKTVEVSSNYVKVAAKKRTINKGSQSTLSIKYVKNGKLVKSAKVQHQHLVNGKWVTARKVKITNGKGKAVLKPASSKAYRFVNYNGKIISPTVNVTVERPVPSSFAIKGSGYGHGVGMSQYGAYQMALEGKSATQILQHYYKGTKVQRLATPKDVRVRVFGHAQHSNSAKFTINTGKWRLRSSTGTTLATGTSKTPITIHAKDGKVEFTVDDTTYTDTLARIHWSGTRYYEPTSSPAVAKLVDDETKASTNGTYRHGRFTVRAVSGKLSIVNDLLLNTEYLYGVAEMPSSWSTAALKSQVIAARTYAMLTMDNSSSSTFDVLDTVAHQNFTGWNKENEGANAVWGKKWSAVVDSTVSSDTKAQVLTNGAQELRRAYYFSSSGGRTANNEDVWGGSQLSWTRGVDDPYSLTAPRNSKKSWSSPLTQAQARGLFGLADVSEIRVTARYSSGQAKTLTAVSSSGKSATLTGTADQIRTRLGLPAAWISGIS